ncbi:uncharacterized protein LOC131226940 [Magnolia sinica]|uniref:uncharacterized protein LOC131226940 n=1 Tax=Magnolia sinica TaxID=86752 RepID=UPI00265B1908|nr:uncharacterized protein LOC131226940 [Magnolia sinica]
MQGVCLTIEATSHPFYKESSILKAFLNYRCPSTNSFHLPEGEMSITLWDVHRIIGLLITGKVFDEFVPTNDELAFVSSPDRIASFSETTTELFKEMSKFPNIHKIHPMQWLAHFSRALRFNGNHSRELEHLHRGMKDRAEYSIYGELAAFIAYWLSIVVFPISKSADVIRPSLFVVVGAMAKGIKYSLDPPALCSIYRGFREIASLIKSSSVGSASTYMAWHYFLGWLDVYFPWTFEVPEKAYVHPSQIPLWFFQKRAMAKTSYDWVKDAISSDAKINYFHFCLPHYIMNTDKVDTESLTTGEKRIIASTSPVLASINLQSESNQSLLSKGKQVVIEESSEGDSESEGSTSSSRNTISDEHEVEEENQDDDYEEREVDISGVEDIIAEDVPTDEGHILPTSEAVPVKTSPIAGEEEDEPLDYGEYGYSPCDHVANTEANSTSPISLPPIIPAASPRFSLPPWAVACEIAFPVESTDLPTPTTIDSSTEARAPSFTEMVEPNPPLVKEMQLLTILVLVEGNLPQSSTASSSSIGTSSNVLSLEKISTYKLALIRNSILAIVEMFKDPD